MRHVFGWKPFEDYINGLMGLSGTIASGNQSQDPGDGVDRRHPNETDYAIMTDCKYTERGSFSVSRAFMEKYMRRAIGSGKRFILPIRFADPAKNKVDDYVVVPLQDFMELLDRYRETE